MSIKLTGTSKDLPACKMHHVSVFIDEDKKANIQSFFHPKQDPEDKEKLTASYRGRLLDGKVIEFPDYYTGLIYEDRGIASEDSDNEWKAVGKFDNFTKWYLDSKFTSEQTIDVACQTWPKIIAAAIHDPIE